MNVQNYLDVIIDFSASSVPKLGSDSIWIIYAIRSGNFSRDNDLLDVTGSSSRIDGAGFLLDLALEVKFYELKSGDRATYAPPPSNKPVAVNVSTRIQLENLLYHLVDLLPKETSMRVGFDFSLGFPFSIGTKLAQKLGVSAPISSKDGANGSVGSQLIKNIGSLIKDEADNTNNRLVVASEVNSILGLNYFWGSSGNAKIGGRLPLLEHSRSPLEFDFEYRLVERVIKATKKLHPSPIRQLFGVGAVGSQSLLGMGLISRFISKLGEDQIAIWPFDKVSRLVTLFEIWPSLTVTKRELRTQIIKAQSLGTEVTFAIDALETLAVHRQLAHIELPAVDQLSRALCLVTGDYRGNFTIPSEVKIDAEREQGGASTEDSISLFNREALDESPIVSEIIRNEGWVSNLVLNLT